MSYMVGSLGSLATDPCYQAWCGPPLEDAAGAPKPEGRFAASTVRWQSLAFPSWVSLTIIFVPGRRVYFSFHYENDIWRASNVRNSARFDTVARAGWTDASIWEEAKRKGDAAIRGLIDRGLARTSVTVVLIGSQTASRRWVRYEIQKSIERGNGLLGIRVHAIKDHNGHSSRRGEIPESLRNGGYPVYDWNAGQLGNAVEVAAIKAGKACLAHNTEGCWSCRLAKGLWL